MNRIVKMGLAACWLFALAACGDVEWFPEQSTPATESGAKVTVTDAGTYISSHRYGTRDYTVTTTKGAFTTYTSLTAAVKTPVSLDTYTDAITSAVVGRMLRAGSSSVLVREILALVE